MVEPYDPPYPVRFRDTEVTFPEGSYWPKELGLNMPEVDQINIGFCTLTLGEPAEAFFSSNPLFSAYQLAHAHVGVEQETRDGWTASWVKRIYNIICLSHGGYVYEKPGIVGVTMIHEYCHVLAYQKGAFGHDQIWANELTRFGLEPWITAPYIMR